MQGKTKEQFFFCFAFVFENTWFLFSWRNTLDFIATHELVAQYVSQTYCMLLSLYTFPVLDFSESFIS